MDDGQLEISLSARITDFAASLNQATGIAGKTFDAIEVRGTQASQKLNAAFANGGATKSISLMSTGFLEAEKKAGSLISTVKSLQATLANTKGLALDKFQAGKTTSPEALLQNVIGAGGVKNFAALSGGALGVGALVAGVVAEQTAELAALKKTADEAGVTASQLAGLQSIMGKLGVSTDATGQMLTRLASHLVNAKANGGELADALTAAGIAFTNADGTIRPTLDVLQNLQQWLKSSTDEQAKLKLATAAVGQEFAGPFLAAIKNGGSALDNLQSATSRAGSAIMNDLAAAAQNGMASLDKLWDRMNTIYSRAKELAHLDLSPSDQKNVAQAHFNEAMGARESLAVASQLRDVSDEEVAAVRDRLAKAAKELAAANPIPTLPGGDPRVKPKAPAIVPAPAAEDDDPAPSKTGGRASKAAKSDDNSAEVIANLRLQLQLASAEGDARKKINDEIKIASELKKAGVSADSEEGKTIVDLVRKTDAATAAEKAHTEALKTKKQIVDLVGTSLETSLENILLHGGKLSSLFTSLAESLAKAAIQAALLGSGPLGGLFGGGSGIIGGAAHLLGFADGGVIQGPGTSTSDSIVARLSAGEFVVNAASARANLPLLHAINAGSMPKFASGGQVGATTIPAIGGSGGVTGASVQINLGDTHVHANGGDAKQNADLAKQTSKHIEGMVRSTVMSEIRNQMRPGNALQSVSR